MIHGRPDKAGIRSDILSPHLSFTLGQWTAIGSMCLTTGLVGVHFMQVRTLGITQKKGERWLPRFEQ